MRTTPDYYVFSTLWIWENHSGKSVVVQKKVCEIDILDAKLLSEDIPNDCNVVLVDDLQYLSDSKEQKKLCDLIRSRGDIHFVFLSRGHVLGWLMPFQLTGTMLIIEASKLSFDRVTVQKMLESQCIQLSDNQKNELIRLTKGYPAAMSIVCRKLKGGAEYKYGDFRQAEFDLFFYFEEDIYLRLEAPLRYFLLSIAPFESLNLELARIVSGDPRAGEFLGIIHRNTNMLSFDKTRTYHIWPFFRKFLLWELQQKFTVAEQRMLYSRAALYYELNEDFEKALAEELQL